MLMCEIVASLLAFAQASPNEGASLDMMRVSLGSQLQKIENIFVAYDQHAHRLDTPLPASLVRHMEALKADRVRRRRTDEQALNPKEAKPLNRLDADVRAEHIEILDAYPNFRATTYKLEAPESSRMDFYLIDDQLLTIEHATKQAVTKKGGSIQLLNPSPMTAIGRRLSGTRNGSLVDLLKHPQHTKQGQDEIIDEHPVVVLSIGPNLPASNRPVHYSDRDWVKLWLAPSFSYLPLRTEYHKVAKSGEEIVHRTELGDVRPVVSKRTNHRPYFPYSITYSNASHKFVWTVKQVKVNDSLSPDDFAPRLPDGVLLHDEGTAPSLRIVGGRSAERRNFVDAAKKAADMITSEAAAVPASNSSFYAWMLAFVGFFSILLGSFFHHRRSTHAS